MPCDTAWQDKDLEFNVSIFGSDDENVDPSRWKTIIANDTHRMDFTCDDRKRRDCDLYVHSRLRMCVEIELSGA